MSHTKYYQYASNKISKKTICDVWADTGCFIVNVLNAISNFLSKGLLHVRKYSVVCSIHEFRSIHYNIILFT